MISRTNDNLIILDLEKKMEPTCDSCVTLCIDWVSFYFSLHRFVFCDHAICPPVWYIWLDHIESVWNCLLLSGGKTTCVENSKWNPFSIIIPLHSQLYSYEIWNSCGKEHLLKLFHKTCHMQLSLKFTLQESRMKHDCRSRSLRVILYMWFFSTHYC